MRNLNKKQKKMLTEMVVEHGITLVWDFNEEDYLRIYNVNPHEDFDGNADRFMTDLDNERKYNAN